MASRKKPGERGYKVNASIRSNFISFPKAAGDIFRWFIAPLMKAYELSEQEMQDYSELHPELLDRLFGGSNRRIVEYMITKRIRRVPGFYLERNTQPEKRNIPKGWRALARFDSRTPGIVFFDLFPHWNYRENDYQYQMTAREFGLIADNIKRIDDE